MEASKTHVESLIQQERKKHYHLIIPMIMFPIIFVIFYFIISSTEELNMPIFIGIFGTILILFMGGFIGSYVSKMNNVTKYGEKLYAYYERLSRINIPEKTYSISEMSSNFFQNQHMWFTKTAISFFPYPPKVSNWKSYAQIDLFELNFSQIKYYYVSGDKYYENKISGGGSTGPNIAGAIVGEQIAGIGGAIVMGQSKTNPIESHLIVHDDRRTVIVYRDSSEMMIKYLLPFDFYEILYGHLPNLCRDQIEKVKEMPNKEKQQTDSLEARLKKLLDMKNAGLIDEKDYLEQKAKILSQM